MDPTLTSLGTVEWKKITDKMRREKQEISK